MADENAVPAPDAPQSPAEGDAKAPEGHQASGPEETIDYEMEPGKVIKIPLSKVNPNVAKLRSEAHQRLSQADKLAKEWEPRAKALAALAGKARENPDALLREAGLTDDEIEAAHEASVARKVRAALQAEEERQDPAKRSSREKDEELTALRKERDDLKSNAQAQEFQALRQQVARHVIAGLDTLPESMREESAGDVLGIVHAALSQGKSVPPPAELAKAARIIARERANILADSLADDDEWTPPPSMAKRIAAQQAKEATKRVAHPATSGTQSQTRTAPKNGDSGQSRGAEILERLLGGGRVIQ
jgi:hypothetical protein